MVIDMCMVAKLSAENGSLRVSRSTRRRKSEDLADHGSLRQAWRLRQGFFDRSECVQDASQPFDVLNFHDFAHLSFNNTPRYCSRTTTMRFTIVFATLVALTATSALAAPTALTARDIKAVLARDESSNVVLRELLQDLTARDIAFEDILSKRGGPPRPPAQPYTPVHRVAQPAVPGQLPHGFSTMHDDRLRPGPQPQQGQLVKNNPAGQVQPQSAPVEQWPPAKGRRDLEARYQQRPRPVQQAPAQPAQPAAPPPPPPGAVPNHFPQAMAGNVHQGAQPQQGQVVQHNPAGQTQGQTAPVQQWPPAGNGRRELSD
ncbi:hypothetical protein EIP91_002561 [Steccherinum ochraceum]|uniref:Uncharacterized protein n=1 Tax=Steccherinum ochraceum TaxID=92696 RepID=A0A4R0RFL3_9APHY|nr:hypothetical protein EIP91_002561 [Steccherinum ochraceum]